MPRVNDWLRLNEAALYYYRQTGFRLPTAMTIKNWIRTGKSDYTGRRVRLRGKQVERGMHLTRKKWVDEFIGRMTGPSIGMVTINGTPVVYDTELPT